MASAWGKSWGLSWGFSWGDIVTDPSAPIYGALGGVSRPSNTQAYARESLQSKTRYLPTNIIRAGSVQSADRVSSLTSKRTRRNTQS